MFANVYVVSTGMARVNIQRKIAIAGPPKGQKSDLLNSSIISQSAVKSALDTANQEQVPII